MPPQVTCASVRPIKTGEHENCIFHSNAVLVHRLNSTSCITSSIFWTHDSYADVWLPKSCNQCVQLAAVWGHGSGTKKSRTLLNLDCVARTMHQCALFCVCSLWPPYRIGQAIIFCPVISIFLLLSSSVYFPRLISAVGDWASTIHTWCGLSANLECMSEMCCTRLTENTGRKKSPFRHHRTTLSGCIFANKACIDNQK